MPGYPDNLETNQYGFISNNNDKHNLKNLKKKNVFFVVVLLLREEVLHLTKLQFHQI